MPMLNIRGLRKGFGGGAVIDDLDLTIGEAEFFTLLGPSGCGKSTTLNCIAGLERPEGGSITVGDTVFVDAERGIFLPPEARNLGMVFQSYALWPHMTVGENVAMPLRIRKVRGSDRRRAIEDALQTVGLANLQNRYPHQLSGGQQQRVALARALAYQPRVLLLDEPLSNLDAKLREQARTWLKRLQQELGITTVFVTHDQDEALALSDRVAVMADGRLAQVGTPTEIYDSPASAEVAAFVGKCNFLEAEVVANATGRVSARLACNGQTFYATASLEGLAPGDSATFAVRPERISVVESSAGVDNVLVGRVLHSSYLGSRWEHEVLVGEQLLHVHTLHPNVDEQVTLALPPDECRVYSVRPSVVEFEAQELAPIGGPTQQ